MPTTQTINDGFDSDLKGILPRLRVYAMSLTRNGDRADDLVQQTALKALAGRKSFRKGTNFNGWVFRIQRNEFISELRRTRWTVNLDDTVAALPCHSPRQEDGLIMRDLLRTFRQLSGAARQALLLATVEGYSQQQIADHAGISVGTVKSRIWRGRVRFDQLLASQA
jgi:RNA polymerase sigma-70 factor (ECF subfamily)